MGIVVLLLLLGMSLLEGYLIFEHLLRRKQITPSSDGRGALGINLLPTINLVFLLIVLVLVVGQLTRRATPSTLPSRAFESAAKQLNQAGAQTLTIRVLSDSKLLFAGKPVTHSEVVSQLKREMANANGRLYVHIQTDRTVQYQFVDPLLTACGRLGVREVILGILPPEAG